MAGGGDAAGRVDQFHYITAVDVPRGIGILGIHRLGDDDPAFSDFFSFHKRIPPLPWPPARGGKFFSSPKRFTAPAKDLNESFLLQKPSRPLQKEPEKKYLKP
jgi:hypothetical protein